ncbi:MAG: DUF11 domain-containing protein, partial [Solirubrobacteraceae bacterium]|nr:DUF11 domain-containing protein [Patulibacter sp.]
DTVVYTIIAANRGNAAAQNVRVVDQLPAGLTYKGTKVTGGTCTRAASTVTCLASTLQPGSALTVKITAVVTDPGKEIANHATVTATGLPSKPAGSQIATASLKASGGPFIVAGVKSLEPYSRPGKTIRIAVKLTNVGEGTATGNRVCFRLPESVVLMHLPSGISQSGGKFCMSAASLKAGKYHRIVLGARVVGPSGSKKPTVTATSANARTKAMTFPLVIRGALPTRAAGVTG